MPHVLDAKAKWDEKSVEYKGTKAILADIPDEMRAKLQEVALAAYRALRVRDYGRIDLRLTEAGEVYVIEVNASCYLEETSEFAASGAAGGMDYVAPINRVAELAMQAIDRPSRPNARPSRRPTVQRPRSPQGRQDMIGLFRRDSCHDAHGSLPVLLPTS